MALWGVDYIVRFLPEYAPGVGNGKFRWLMLSLGLINLIAFGAGTYFGALFTEKLAQKNISAYGWVPGFVLIIGVPALIGAYWVNNIYLHLGLLSVYLVSGGVYLGPSFAAAQTLAPINMRAMSTALFFLILNLIALGGGPTYIGIVSSASQNSTVKCMRFA